MIPKKIHYCWFGRNPLPKSAQKYIQSWRKFFPEYEIIEWNEDNFDVDIVAYTKEAYEAKKYAFVSDYARFWILYRFGGLYFDTDVEVIKSFDDIVDKGPFMGIEVESSSPTIPPLVAPGLGLGADTGMSFYKTILEYYDHIHFLNDNGTQNTTTVVKHISKLLKENGLQNRNDLQCVDGIWIYPMDYFNPLDDNTGTLKITDNTRSIHWYTKTWMDRSPFRIWISRTFHRFFGVDCFSWIKRMRKK